MQKRNRNYTLGISGDTFPQPIQITLPFTVEFDITRNQLTSSNVCQIRIYNLSAKHRNALQKNTMNYAYPMINIVFRAGYGTDTPIIFTGNVSQGWSMREGTNFITQLELFDGGFAFINGQTSLTVPKGTSYQSVIASLIQSLPDVAVGSIGNYPGTTQKAVTYSGNTIDILNQITGGAFFIDNGVGNSLGNSEYTTAVQSIPVIDASVGLLNTPQLENGIVRFDLMFEPRLNVGTIIQLKSGNLQEALQNNFNGQYKVTSVKHRGMISPTVCGEVVTSLEMLSNQTLSPFIGVGKYGK